MRRPLLALLFVVAAAAAGVSPAAAIATRWTPIANITDPKVQDLGSWAIDQHNADDGDNLLFHHVYSGATLVVTARVQYRLRLMAADGPAVHGYEAAFFGHDFHGLLLSDFEQVQ